jgi:hypothetical protein
MKTEIIENYLSEEQARLHAASEAKTFDRGGGQYMC